jgi:predicted pyridoxine 5'-phosphate oxidase superfamily flavin-nucleotide-binding protein
MNSSRNLTLALLLAAVASAASAQDATRSQVNSEVAAAMRNGDIVSGEMAMSPRQMQSDLSAPAVSGISRAQVQAELAAAQRNGEMSVAGNGSIRAKDLTPGLYPADPVVAGKTRAQVNAELAMAIRDGDMPAEGELGLTEYQVHPQQYARQRAIDSAAQLAQHNDVHASGSN